MFNLFKKRYTNKRELEIDTFFEHVNWYVLLVNIWKLYPTFHSSVNHIIILKNNIELIKKRWKDNQQMTLPQVLDSLELLPISWKFKKAKLDQSTDWYWMSIEELMYSMHVPEQHFIIWRSAYNRFGIKRRKAIFILIKNLSTKHIKLILKNQSITIGHRYSNIFMNELEKRSEKL